MPVRRSWRHVRTLEVVILVTGTAFDGGNAIAIGTTPYIHRVPVSIISLPRKVSLGMAIHAARMM
jgi:hypothetical protein